MRSHQIVPAVALHTNQTGASTKANTMGMRPMQERALLPARRAVPADQIAASLRQEAGR